MNRQSQNGSSTCPLPMQRRWADRARMEAPCESPPHSNTPGQWRQNGGTTCVLFLFKHTGQTEPEWRHHTWPIFVQKHWTDRAGARDQGVMPLCLCLASPQLPCRLPVKPLFALGQAGRYPARWLLHDGKAGGLLPDHPQHHLWVRAGKTLHTRPGCAPACLWPERHRTQCHFHLLPTSIITPGHQ